MTSCEPKQEIFALNDRGRSGEFYEKSKISVGAWPAFSETPERIYAIIVYFLWNLKQEALLTENPRHVKIALDLPYASVYLDFRRCWLNEAKESKEILGQFFGQ